LVDLGKRTKPLGSSSGAGVGIEESNYLQEAAVALWRAGLAARENIAVEVGVWGFAVGGERVGRIFAFETEKVAMKPQPQEAGEIDREIR
jgi:hypothetical protein